MLRHSLALALLCVTAFGSQAAERPRLFQSPSRPAVPVVKDAASARNPIDRFVLAALEAKGLRLSAEADRHRLLRRVTFTLTGLPPTDEEQRAFAKDTRPGAYDRAVERLLASPRFGERQAQHWLDVVRYAETDGFKEDALRPEAHRFRDWVIRAFNANVGYDTFVRWQLAGDELAADDPDALIAAGFNRLWPDEYNAAKLFERRQEILDDNTDTVGLAFLGLTVGCARCHDHKYDPVSQKDYFRLQSFFAAMQPRDVPALGPAGRREYATRLAAWENRTAEVRSEMAAIVAKKRRELSDSTLTRFAADIRMAVKTAPVKRTPLQEQIALIAYKQLDRAADSAPGKLAPAEKKRYQDLEKKLASFGPAPRPPVAMTVQDIGALAPPTHRLIGGDSRKPAAVVLPAFPASLGGGKVDTALPAGVTSTGRRAALARWLTQPEHPLTARVMVNRLWQHHFGKGLVATASDFGAQGGQPSHPDLLDWLATELVASGWDLKHMHRLMVTSAAYRQGSTVDADDANHARAMKLDPENHLLWHARRRRMEGEAIRDAMLHLSGELNGRMFGPSARPELPAAVGKGAWKPDANPVDRNRRSVYVLAKRNLRYPLFEAFDQPDLHNSCSRRETTTTAPQALLLLNGELAREQARHWLKVLQGRHGESPRAIVAAAYRAAWGRPADEDEIDLGVRFVDRQAARHAGTPHPLSHKGRGEHGRRAALADFCHAVLNTNEFVYLD